MKSGAVRVLVTVTLNPNQLRAHLEPIAAVPQVARIDLIADNVSGQVEKLYTRVPPRWLARTVGRAAAKLAVGTVVSLRERPTWVLGYNLVPHGVNALLIGRITGRRVLIHLIGGPVEWRGGGFESDNAVLSRLSRPVPWLERALVWTIRRADVVAVMGSGAKQDLVRRGLDPARIFVLPARVEDRLFSQEALEQPTYDLVTASQLISRKRLEDFLEAVAQLRLERPQLRAAIAGRGPLETALRARARELGVDDAVDFLGFVTDIGGLYANSLVFALTSSYEGLSIALTEAMACGLPAVATDVGEIRDLVDPGENGFLFDVGDVGGLVAHTARLLADEPLRRAMGERARAATRAYVSGDEITAINGRILRVSDELTTTNGGVLPGV